MKGKIAIIIKNDRIKYEFTLRRNITVIRGDSATGKTKLIEMIRDFNLLGRESGVELTCRYKCVVIEGNTWEQQLSGISGSIVFIDEANKFVSTKTFARTIQNTDNYYVIATRDNLPMLPYSVDEIYGIRSTGKYGGLKQTYNELYRIYSQHDINTKINPTLIITEDSNSGFQFFKDAFAKKNIKCIHADGKSNIVKEAKKYRTEKLLIIADSAAYGPEMENTMTLVNEFPNVAIYLPESFEWLILISDCIGDSSIMKMSSDWSEYIECRQYFSWEQFFTDLLIQKTKDTYLQYNKKQINPAYLNDSIRLKILKNIQNIDFEKQE